VRPTFHPRLINGPFGDPALLVRLLGMGRNLLLDLGDLRDLPARPVLKASHGFVTHAHVDHFCGLDTVVRYSLGRARTFRLVGPPGIADRTAAKLGGYTWNLVSSYREAFRLEVLEWGNRGGHLWAFPCREGFPRIDRGPAHLLETAPGVREVHREIAFRVLAAELDHQVPCLAYAVEEPFHVSICRDALSRLDLPPGAWLRPLKEAALRGDGPGTPIETPAGRQPLGALRDAGLFRIGEGQKLAYVADCLWGGETVGRAVALCRRSHILYCEAAFLEEDRHRARERYHLTAAQAGELARRAEARELRLFHFSPKYRGREGELLSEAAAAFGGPVFLGA
jgi:ribonuclease Z